MVQCVWVTYDMGIRLLLLAVTFNFEEVLSWWHMRGLMRLRLPRAFCQVPRILCTLRALSILQCFLHLVPDWIKCSLFAHSISLNLAFLLRINSLSCFMFSVARRMLPIFSNNFPLYCIIIRSIHVGFIKRYIFLLCYFSLFLALCAQYSYRLLCYQGIIFSIYPAR